MVGGCVITCGMMPGGCVVLSCCRVVVLSCGRVDVFPWCSHVAGGCVVVGLWRHLVLWRCGRVAQDLCDCVVLCLCDTVSVSCSCVAVGLCLSHWCCGRVVVLLGDCMVACSCGRVAVWLCGCVGARGCSVAVGRLDRRWMGDDLSCAQRFWGPFAHHPTAHSSTTGGTLALPMPATACYYISREARMRDARCQGYVGAGRAFHQRGGWEGSFCAALSLCFGGGASHVPLALWEG